MLERNLQNSAICKIAKLLFGSNAPYERLIYSRHVEFTRQLCTVSTEAGADWTVGKSVIGTESNLLKKKKKKKNEKEKKKKKKKKKRKKKKHKKRKFIGKDQNT